MRQEQEKHEAPCGFWRSRYASGLLVLGAVAAYFLWTEHRAHLLGFLPYLLVLACPLMHVFMHHGHGGHRHKHGGREPAAEDAHQTGPGERE